MSAVALLQEAIELSRTMTFALIDDMKDLPLQPPTSNGGNHPLWILGHLTYAESNLIQHVIGGQENPLIGWKMMFGASTEPSYDASHYLPWDELRTKADEVHRQTNACIAELSDGDLDLPSKNPPPGREHVFGTVGKCLTMVALHPMTHRGQLADARRMAGRPPLFV
ncbi:MAG: DinB family protein [Pirellulaceae bacterium]